MALHETPRPPAQPAGPAPMLPSGQAGGALIASASARMARATRALRLAWDEPDEDRRQAALHRHFQEFPPVITARHTACRLR